MSTSSITLHCWQCGHSIHRWTGYVCVDAVAAQARPRVPVPWQAYHYHCDDPADCPVYWFDVSRLDTAQDLIDRAVHLAANEWFAHTDWPVFAAKVA
jgi:hypothetical protein